MYFGKYAPWEHYPKTLRQHEVQNPISVIKDFFSCDSVQGHKQGLKEWRHFVVNDKSFKDERHGPGTLLFDYDMNLKLLEAMYLLLLDYRHFAYQREKITEAQLETEKTSWEYFPKNLSQKELLNPYKAVRKVFKKISPQAYRDYLHEWVHAALYNKADNEGLYAGEIILVYDNLVKLYSAAWIIFKREHEDFETRDGCIIESRSGINFEPIELRAIDPNPSAAEKLGLEELENLILKICPFAEMIVHVGTYPEPFTYYLVILISDNEKTPEHEVSNKIEDHCRYLVNVHTFVHKANSAKTGAKMGKRFWCRVLNKGKIIYQAADLQLPAFAEITNEVLIERAKFHWERWGIQGKEFFKGAEVYRADENYRLAVFLLHQSVESTLKAIIQAILGYRVQMHNINRLVKISLLFTDELQNVFELDTDEGVKLFTLLQISYTASRYHNEFNPDADTVSALSKKVGQLAEMAERIYKQFIA